MYIRNLLYIVCTVALTVSASANWRVDIGAERLRKVDSVIRSQVGIRETGRNAGPVVKYLKSVGLGAGNPYCYAGLFWCFAHLDYNPLFRTGLASLGRRELEKIAVRDTTARDKGLIFWQFPDRPFGHVEYIYQRDRAGWVRTVGFNTGGKDERDGGGVYYKIRNLRHPLGRMRVTSIIYFS